MILVREGTKEEVVVLSNLIPEMDDPHQLVVYEERMKDKYQLILIAEVDGIAAGFKVGYDKFDDGSFYTWMGGVLSRFRRMGIARQLADKQEEIVKKEGYRSVKLKTRNMHQNMLLFAITSGFKITKVLMSKDDVDQNRILLSKVL